MTSGNEGNGADNSEVAVITHLLEVEKEAQTLLSEAQDEANKRTADYKAKAESTFMEARDKIVSEIEASYNAQTEAIREDHEEQIAAYKAGIEGINQNQEAFNAVVLGCLEG